MSLIKNSFFHLSTFFAFLEFFLGNSVFIMLIYSIFKKVKLKFPRFSSIGFLTFFLSIFIIMNEKQNDITNLNFVNSEFYINDYISFVVKLIICCGVSIFFFFVDTNNSKITFFIRMVQWIATRAPVLAFCWT